VTPQSTIGKRGFICTFRFLWCWTGFTNRPAWPNNEVLYQFGSNVSGDERTIIRNSAARWNATGVYPKLREASGGTTIYMAPYSSTYCGLSPIGRTQVSAIPIMLIVRDNYCLQDHTIWHEFGHAAGLNHEHQRCDRDKYIEVTYAWWEFINYNKLCNWGEDIGFFDFDSIMMYRGTNIKPRSPMPSSGWMGNPNDTRARSTFSLGDIKGLSTLYPR